MPGWQVVASPLNPWPAFNLAWSQLLVDADAICREDADRSHWDMASVWQMELELNRVERQGPSRFHRDHLVAVELVSTAIREIIRSMRDEPGIPPTAACTWYRRTRQSTSWFFDRAVLFQPNIFIAAPRPVPRHSTPADRALQDAIWMAALGPRAFARYRARAAWRRRRYRSAIRLALSSFVA